MTSIFAAADRYARAFAARRRRRVAQLPPQLPLAPVRLVQHVLRRLHALRAVERRERAHELQLAAERAIAAVREQQSKLQGRGGG